VITLPGAPVHDWSVCARSVACVLTASACVVAMGAMARANPAMRANGGRGIVAFERAGSWGKADAILETWGTRGRRAARTSLHWDLLFLVAYGAFFVAVAGAAQAPLLRTGHPRWALVAAWAGLAGAVAAACDLAEDGVLLHEFDGARAANLPRVAAAFAAVKFLLVYGAGAVLATVGIALVARGT
jgi:hypothetical protein